MNEFELGQIVCTRGIAEAMKKRPKADLTGDDLAFEVEDGFTSESGDLCAH